MSEGIIISLVGALQVVLVAIIGVLAQRIGSVRDQVVNHHVDADGKPILMRDENDSRHAETRGWFKNLQRDIGGMREEIRGLRSDLRHERDRIDELEDTINPRKD